MANNNQLLNQCRLFYLLQFSGLVIVICVRVYFVSMSRTRIELVQFTLAGKYTAHSCFSDNRIGGFQFCCSFFLSSRWCFPLNFWKQWTQTITFWWLEIYERICNVPTVSEAKVCTHFVCVRYRCEKQQYPTNRAFTATLANALEKWKKQYMCKQIADRFFFLFRSPRFVFCSVVLFVEKKK